ncbi:MAG: mechanosensitive ion channel family protein [Bacteroidales bacterium]|nr:mechanosensitive ion channel family protein [Bacteroidales bacterium]
MKEFFNAIYYQNTVGEWLIALSIIIGGAILGKLVYWFIGKVIKKYTNKTKTKLDDIIIDMVEEPIAFSIILFAGWYAIGTLSFPDNWGVFIGHVFYILVTFNVAWLIVRLLDSIIVEYVVPLAEESKSTLDDQLLPILRKSLKAAVWVMALIIGLDNAGYNIGTLLAGVGIGGIALAMAAKDTVSNIFGGLTVFIDKPFAVKDRILIDGIDGTVEEIGIRSTRIRNLAGRLVTIQNSTFTSNKIENISSEPNRKISLTLGLTYDTDESGMQKAMDILKKIATDNQSTEEKVLVGFTGFGDFSMNITFIYYVRSGESVLGVQTEINSEVLKQFNAAKLEFAFPTQTIYNIPQS